MTADLSKIEVEIVKIPKSERAAHVARIEKELRGTVEERNERLRTKALGELAAVQVELAGRYGVLERSTFEGKTREALDFLAETLEGERERVYERSIYLRLATEFDKANLVAEEWRHNASVAAGVALKAENLRRFVEARTKARDHGSLDKFEADFPAMLEDFRLG